MTGNIQERPPAGLGRADDRQVFHAASLGPTMAEVVQDIQAALSGRDLSFILMFADPKLASPDLAAGLAAAFPDCQVIGCTTAGEIGLEGYQEDSVVALGFSAGDFAISTQLVEGLSGFTLDRGADIAHALLHGTGGPAPGAALPHKFALTLIDGCARAEDALLAAITPGLAGIPLIGGSAGDGLDFARSRVLHEGRFIEDAAVIAMVHTRCPVEVIRFDHFRPLEQRMVVTGAIPAERLVTEINAEPAAPEYARVVGKDPAQLSPFIFAENPVVVRIGDEHFVRAIQKVEENGDLRFYSAIDEGMVLTVAEAGDIVAEFDSALGGLSARRRPAMILGFDCVLRRLEAEQKQRTRQVSEVLKRHGVFGFSTYGEQFGAMHVNQTFTAAAIYPPDPAHG